MDQWNFPTALEVIPVVEAIQEVEVILVEAGEEEVSVQEEVEEIEEIEEDSEVVDEATSEEVEVVVEAVEADLPGNRLPGSLPIRVVKPHHRQRLQRSRMQPPKLWQSSTKRLQVSLVIQNGQDTAPRDSLSNYMRIISN